MCLSSRYALPIINWPRRFPLSCDVYHHRSHANNARLQQRNLNNAFAYDLVPSPSVIVAALKAARRVNDYPTAVRIFEGAYPGPTQLQDTSADSSIKSAKMWDNQKADARSLSTGIKAKVENKGQYDEYLKELEPLREELGINLKESMYPDPTR